MKLCHQWENGWKSVAMGKTFISSLCLLQHMGNAPLSLTFGRRVPLCDLNWLTWTLWSCCLRPPSADITGLPLLAWLYLFFWCSRQSQGGEESSMFCVFSSSRRRITDKGSPKFHLWLSFSPSSPVVAEPGGVWMPSKAEWKVESLWPAGGTHQSGTSNNILVY